MRPVLSRTEPPPHPPSSNNAAIEGATPRGHEVNTWNGLVGPSGMPREVVARLAEEGRKIVADPAFRAQLERAGIMPLGETRDAFSARIKADLAKWKPVIEAAGIHPE
ncbi:tripartite tricarboxylate transporter substrate-binding protein [Cupriavidus lacunae]|uniref:tripartite tricarboxylate transporter substrate-binding protein n=1 Tax=Cupriavidus lacunae TaxID=2666307 RepID=UPI001FC96F50|nr:tripartite tricarboxylate transporter substrate-binding protein [Cupriavidus lacunae]